jgi:P-type Cu+ transporter
VAARPLGSEDRVVLAIGGMTCAACARRVEKALRKAPGVSDAVVNLATHEATVVYLPDTTGIAPLEAVVADAGYRASPADRRAGHDVDRDLRTRALVALILGLPVVVLGMSHGLVHVPGARWIELGLAVPVVVWAGAPILRGAVGALRHRTADMNVLVTIGALASIGYGYHEAAVAIVGFVVLGRWLEARARRHAGEALGRLRRLVPPTAAIVVDGEERRVAVERLAPGDLVVIRPGQTIPIDGDIVEGSSSVAEAVLTGEAMPVDRRPGDPVLAGTSNGWGRLVVRASRDPGATAIAGIVATVEAALGSRAPMARIVDRVAAVFTPLVVAVAALTLTGWMIAGPVADAVAAAVAVLVVACPCALGLATPTALVAALGRGAERGVLFRSAAALERLGAVDTVVLDKTGTLTEGKPDLIVTDASPGPGDARVLALVAGAEEGSEHPLAGAFLRAAGAHGVGVPAATAFAAIPGRGVVATVDGHEVVVGSPRLVSERGVAVDAARLDPVTARGLTPVVAAIDGELAAVYGIGDAPRAGATDAVAALGARGVSVVMLTGDAVAVAERVSAELGISAVIAETLPADKAEHVTRLRAGGRRVAMVGDGVNDAPALAAADVGVAMGSASDVATESAEVVLLRDDLGALTASVLLARRTRSVIRQNLFWAFSYNVVALPIAAAGLLSPMIASAAMALSSVSVVLNSLRLRAR